MEKQEFREAQEVTQDLEGQENKEVLQQSQRDTDQTRRWSKGNGIVPPVPHPRENPAGSRVESNPDYGEHSQVRFYIPGVTQSRFPAAQENLQGASARALLTPGKGHRGTTRSLNRLVNVYLQLQSVTDTNHLQQLPEKMRQSVQRQSWAGKDCTCPR